MDVDDAVIVSVYAALPEGEVRLALTADVDLIGHVPVFPDGWPRDLWRGLRVIAVAELPREHDHRKRDEKDEQQPG